MTQPGRKISIYVPSDLVPVIDAVENASEYIAESVRMRQRREQLSAVLRDAGYVVNPERVEKMRQRLYALDRLNAEAIAEGTE